MWTLAWGQQGSIRHFCTFGEEHNQKHSLNCLHLQPHLVLLLPCFLNIYKLSGEFLEFLEHWHKLFSHLLYSSSSPSLAWLPSPSHRSSFKWPPQDLLPHSGSPQTQTSTLLTWGYKPDKAVIRPSQQAEGQTRCILPDLGVLWMCDQDDGKKYLLYLMKMISLIVQECPYNKHFFNRRQLRFTAY